MRKNKRLIVLAFIFTFALCGVAYAAWTDHLFINGNVETGDLCMEWIDNDGYPKIVGDSEHLMTVSIEQTDPHHTRVVLSNMYPGAVGKFDVLGMNKGSIPVKFQNAQVIFDNPADPAIPYLNAWGDFVADEDNDNVQDKWGTFNKVLLDNFDDEMNSNPYLASVVLEPNGWISFNKNAGDPNDNCIYIQLDPNAPNAVTEGKEIGFTLVTNWKQFNN